VRPSVGDYAFLSDSQSAAMVDRRGSIDWWSVLRNDVGLLAEMADPATGELIGNIPQAFSHVGLINTAWRLTQEIG